MLKINFFQVVHHFGLAKNVISNVTVPIILNAIRSVEIVPWAVKMEEVVLTVKD